MAKIHYTNVPCGAKPMFSDPENTVLWFPDGRQLTALELGIQPTPLRQSGIVSKVTCKNCLKWLSKTGVK